MSTDELSDSDDGLDIGVSEKYRKSRLDCPSPGWVWRDNGPRGPAWYPPISEGIVAAEREHLALHCVDDVRSPGKILARVGAQQNDMMFVEYIERTNDALDGVERLFHTCFEDVGVLPTFDLAYSFCSQSVNKDYLNPMWFYVNGGSSKS